MTTFNGDPSPEALAQHADRYGYALGAYLWGQKRMAIEQDIFGQVAVALGESLDEEALTLAIRELVQGYSRAFRQFRFVSHVLTSRNMETPPVDEIFAEVYRHIPTSPVLQILLGWSPALEGGNSENTR